MGHWAENFYEEENNLFFKKSYIASLKSYTASGF